MPTPTPTPTGDLPTIVTRLRGPSPIIFARHADGMAYDGHLTRQAERAERDEAADTITLLASLLDGVLADDPQAIRDAAAWLTTNRPAVAGGDSVGEGEG